MITIHVQDMCTSIGAEAGGFITWLGPGEMLGVFARGSAAVAWSLNIVEAMSTHLWWAAVSG